MNKFFQIAKQFVMLSVVVAGALANVGCLTISSSTRTSFSSSHRTADGGTVTVTKTETTVYNSGIVERVTEPPVLRHDPYFYKSLQPATTRCLEIPSPFPGWHDIPNPIQGDRFEKPQKQQCEPPRECHPYGGHGGGNRWRRR